MIKSTFGQEKRKFLCSSQKKKTNKTVRIKSNNFFQIHFFDQDIKGGKLDGNFHQCA